MSRVIGGLLLTVFSSLVLAQYPVKPIRVVVPFPAGSATDTITRVLAHSVSQSIGQTLAVENKAGADGAAFVLSPSSPEKLAAFVKEQMESYRRILRAAGVEPE